jgi:uncharacterized protein (TIGR00369 family)
MEESKAPEPLEAYPGCFVCGDRNPVGMGIVFFYDGEKAFADFTAEAAYEGYRTVCHGGILASVLDEVMIKAVLAEGTAAVTTRMEVRYRRPARTGTRLRAEGWVTRRGRRLIETEGFIKTADGTLLCEAAAAYGVVRDEKLKALLAPEEES